MKQKQLSILAASLIAAFAANVAFAGNIQSSSVAIAREVITDDLQSVTAPMITYRFQGDVDATSQAQTFQVQLYLSNGGTWNTATANSVVLVDGRAVPTAPDLAVTPLISADGKYLYATFTVAQGAANSYVTPTIKFNPVGVASTLKTLKAVVGTVTPCENKVIPLKVDFLHFNGVTAAGLATTQNATADEHQRNGQNSTGTLLTFPTNIAVTVATSTGSAKINPAVGSLNTRFIATGAGTTYISTSLLNLGTVAMSQQATGYDSDLTTPYLLGDVTAPAGVGAGAAKVGTAATQQDGAVEASDVVVTVTSSQGYAPSSTVYLSANPVTCAPIVGAPATTYVGNIATLKVGAAQINAALAASGTNALAVCYDVSALTVGAGVIPPSTFTATAVLSKAAGALPFPEQNNSCNGNLYPLSGGVKVDVRNYATSKVAGDWMSVIRLINPSETNTATVYGQLIHSDGSYGGWGQIATLAPRAVTNMTAAEIDALTINAPATNGTGYVAGATGPTAAANKGERLRITADGVSSLRVQNYVFNSKTGIAIEASGSQGVDFEGTPDRAPVNEGQYQDQDAQRGLAK